MKKWGTKNSKKRKSTKEKNGMHEEKKGKLKERKGRQSRPIFQYVKGERVSEAEDMI